MLTPMTLAEHRSLGARLQETRDFALRDAIALANRYGKTSQLARRANRVGLALAGLRDALENQMYRDHPDADAISTYHPAPSARPYPPCPGCGADSVYVPSLDRFLHCDGSENDPCWLRIHRGEAATDSDAAPEESTSNPAPVPMSRLTALERRERRRRRPGTVVFTIDMAPARWGFGPDHPSRHQP